jgi:hypothetical protein
MFDPTEAARRQLVAEINAMPWPREHLEARYGQVWDPHQLKLEFEVIGFRAPFVVARRRSDGVLGSLMFQNEPRLYFSFEPD